MGFLARLSRVVPLLIIMAVAAGLIYVVVTYRHSPARAKEVLIKIFTWFNGIVVGFLLSVVLKVTLCGYFIYSFVRGIIN